MTPEEYLKGRYKLVGVHTSSLFDYYEVIALMEDYHHAKMLTYTIDFHPNIVPPQDIEVRTDVTTNTADVVGRSEQLATFLQHRLGKKYGIYFEQQDIDELIDVTNCLQRWVYVTCAHNKLK